MLAVVAQAAGEIEQAAHARHVLRAQCDRGQPAVGLAGDDDMVVVDPVQFARIFNGVEHVGGLGVAIGGHIAAIVGVGAARFGEAAAHRHHHRVAALDEGGGHDDEAVARLQARIARFLAMVDDQ